MGITKSRIKTQAVNMPKQFKDGQKALWASSLPCDQLTLVEIISEHPDGNGKYYIRKPDGSTDTTDTDFLWDIPKECSATQYASQPQA